MALAPQLVLVWVTLAHFQGHNRVGENRGCYALLFFMFIFFSSWCSMLVD